MYTVSVLVGFERFNTLSSASIAAAAAEIDCRLYELT